MRPRDRQGDVAAATFGLRKVLPSVGLVSMLGKVLGKVKAATEAAAF